MTSDDSTPGDVATPKTGGTSRRSFLRQGLYLAGGLAASGPLLAACGGDDEGDTASGGGGGSTSGGGGGGGTVKVGGILDATGALALYGTPLVNTQQLAIETINANGGLLGRQLELVFVDSQSDIAKYTAGAKELAQNDDVVVVHGGITSASREAIRPIFNAAEKLYFYNQLYEGGVCDRLTFNTGVVPTQQMEVLIPYLTENFGPKIYTVAADYNYGQISADWIKKYAQDSGAELVGEEFFPLDVSDFGASLQKIQAAQPDVVLSCLVGNNHLAFYRGFAGAGLRSSIQIASTVVGLGNEHIVLDPKDGEGIIVAMPYFEEIDTPENKSFVETYRAKFPNTDYINDEVNTNWTGWNIWAKAVEQAESFENDAVIEVLEQGVEYDAPEGKVRMVGPAHHTTHNVRIAKVNANRGFDILETFTDLEPVFEIETCNLVEDPDQSVQNEPKL